jgi:hypothetical protein
LVFFVQFVLLADEDQLRVVVKGAEQFLRKQGLRVKHVDLFELVLQLLEAKGYLDVVLEEEPSWSKGDLFDTPCRTWPNPPPLWCRS